MEKGVSQTLEKMMSYQNKKFLLVMVVKFLALSLMKLHTRRHSNYTIGLGRDFIMAPISVFVAKALSMNRKLEQVGSQEKTTS